MLSEAVVILMQLPPLAFGPAQPPRAFAMPRALVCDIHDLGRIQEPATPAWMASPATPLAPHLLPRQERRLLNPALEFALVLGALASTRGSWDERPWSTRAWQATGAVTPVLIPPQAPPSSSLRQP